MSLSILLFVAYAALQVGDGVTTTLALSRPGYREADPLVSLAIRLLGTNGGIVLAKAVATGLGLVILLLGHGSSAVAWVLGGLVAAYAAVVGWNIRELMKG